MVRYILSLALFLLTAGMALAQTPAWTGQPFKAGDVPSGYCPEPQYLNSSGVWTTEAVWQADVRNYWPDGSVRFAIVSWIEPAASSGVTNDVSIVPISASTACNSSGVAGAGSESIANMLANYNFDAHINLTGTASPSVSARAILTAANAGSGICTPTSGDIDGKIATSGCLATYWLKGPVITAIILEDRFGRTYDMNTDNGTGNPLHPIFEAWFFPCGTCASPNQAMVGYMLQDMWASNTGTKSARNQTYSMALTYGNSSPVTINASATGAWGSGSQTVITRSGFHRTYCISGPGAGTVDTCNPTPVIDHNYGYLSQTKFFPNWDPNLLLYPTFVSNFLTALNNANTITALAGSSTNGIGFYPSGASGQRCGGSAPGTTGDGCTTGGMDNGGTGDYHGPLNTWEIVWLLTSDAGMQTVNLRNSDVGYALPYFFMEADSGTGHGGAFDTTNANTASPTPGPTGTLGRVISINNRTQINLQDASTDPGCNNNYTNDYVTFGTGGESTGVWSGTTGPAHWPNLAFLSYIFTGEYAYYEEQVMQAAYSVGIAGDYSPGTRACYQPTSNGALRMGAAGYFEADQERGNDWQMREAMLGAFIALDGSPEQTYLTDKVKMNIAAHEGSHGIPTCDLGAGGVTYLYCSGSGIGPSQSAFSYGQGARATSSNVANAALGVWAQGPLSISPPPTGAYAVQYPMCTDTVDTIHSGQSGAFNPSLPGGGLATPVSGPFFVNGYCPVSNPPTTTAQGANSTFQTAYSTVTLGWLNDLGYCPGSCSLLQYVANFWINAAINPSANPHFLSAYAFPTLDSGGSKFTNWGSGTGGVNQSSLFLSTGIPTGWVAPQGTAGCPYGQNGQADEWYIAESESALSYVYTLTENFSGSGYTGVNAYNFIRGSNAISICLPYFNTTGLSNPAGSGTGNFGSPKWDIVPRSIIAGSSIINPPQATPPSCSPGSGTYIVTQTVTCTNPNSGTTILCYTFSNPNSTLPVTNGSGTGCPTGTAYTTTLSIGATGVLNIVAGVAGGTDSSEVTYTYTLNRTAPAPATAIFAGTRLQFQ